MYMWVKTPSFLCFCCPSYPCSSRTGTPLGVPLHATGPGSPALYQDALGCSSGSLYPSATGFTSSRSSWPSLPFRTIPGYKHVMGPIRPLAITVLQLCAFLKPQSLNSVGNWPGEIPGNESVYVLLEQEAIRTSFTAGPITFF